MLERMVQVQCYSAYRPDERPVKLLLGERAEPLNIQMIEDRWYSPGATFFRALVEDGDQYLLRHEEAQDVWNFAGYRAAIPLTQKMYRAYSQVTK